MLTALPNNSNKELNILTSQLNDLERFIDSCNEHLVAKTQSFEAEVKKTHRACAVLESLVIELEQSSIRKQNYPASGNENAKNDDQINAAETQVDESMSLDQVPTPPSVHGRYAESEVDSPAPAPPTHSSSMSPASDDSRLNEQVLVQAPSSAQKLGYSAYSLSPFNPHRYKQMMMVPPSTAKPQQRLPAAMEAGNNPFLAPMRETGVGLNRRTGPAQSKYHGMLMQNVSNLPVEDEVTIGGYKGVDLLSLETPLAHVSTMARSMPSLTLIQSSAEEQKAMQPVTESEYVMLPNYVRLQLDLAFLNGAIRLINEYLSSFPTVTNSFFSDQLESMRFCDPMKVKPILIALVHTDRLKSKSDGNSTRQYFLE